MSNITQAREEKIKGDHVLAHKQQEIHGYVITIVATNVHQYPQYVLYYPRFIYKYYIYCKKQKKLKSYFEKKKVKG